MTVRPELSKPRESYYYSKIDGSFGLSLAATNFDAVGDYNPDHAYTMGISYPDPERYFSNGFAKPHYFQV